MNRSRTCSRRVALSVPRRRGDEPARYRQNAKWLLTVPRRRGDEPTYSDILSSVVNRSPQARG